MGRPPSWRKTVVVGAGPVGSLAAIYAANRGDEVEVYDLRPDLRDTSTHPSSLVKSINLALSERGINALRSAGYDDLLATVFATTIPMHGRMIHTATRSGTLHEEAQAYDVHGRYQRSIDRNELSKVLLDKLDTMPNVKIFFQKKLTGADFDSKKAWFEDLCAKPKYSRENPSRRAPEHEVHFDFMIGADGAHSAVRFHLMKFATVDYSQSYIDCLWSEFTMQPALQSSRYPGGYQISPNHLHIWPAGSSMFIALPTHGGSFVCTLFGPVALFKQLEAATDSSDASSFIEKFDELFPGATSHIEPQSLLEQFRRNPHLSLINIKCAPHHYGSSVVILGDSANAMVPFYGQGMNAGLESVRALFDIIDRSKQAASRQEAGFSTQVHDDERIDWHNPEHCLATALQEYTHTRVADAHAISDLAMGNYAEMTSGVVSRRYKLRKSTEETVDKWFPSLDWKTQYARVSFGNERYSDVVAKAKKQGRVFDTLLNTASIGVVAGVAYYVWKYTRLSGR
ncbi:kynurenine 3-monooxygenase, mitochondrial precursor [Exophiala xenobiotica]|uniref:Kynurenine 3-monooxygenase n=1 Tax=Lithohypha guttulata TaxID=1690604 RepID=A0ABR0JVJ9_9EURO|nr:kynurenine 3-monooxygenase, mitochondrial precursor [Lithohypha guttulata]KAK5309785.1 kynurenine 3-monooxygenase, mitochondrial precursor [Exophiala xenobiotica]